MHSVFRYMEVNFTILCLKHSVIYSNKITFAAQSTRFKIETMLKMFFEAGGTPDCAKNPEDAETLKGLLDFIYFVLASFVLSMFTKYSIYLQRYLDTSVGNPP